MRLPEKIAVTVDMQETNDITFSNALLIEASRKSAARLVSYISDTCSIFPYFPSRFRGSIVVSISACHAEDPGSIPGRGVFLPPPVAYFILEPRIKPLAKKSGKRSTK